MYLGREDRAYRFACDRDRHGGAEGDLITVVVSVENTKFVSGHDTSWLEEGHDACRTDFTSASENMEWVVRSTSQVVALLSFEKIPLAGGKLLPSMPAEDGTISTVEGVNIAQEHHVVAFVNSSSVRTSRALLRIFSAAPTAHSQNATIEHFSGTRMRCGPNERAKLSLACRYCSTTWTARCCLALLLPDPKQVPARKRRGTASFRARCKQRQFKTRACIQPS